MLKIIDQNRHPSLSISDVQPTQIQVNFQTPHACRPSSPLPISDVNIFLFFAGRHQEQSHYHFTAGHARWHWDQLDRCYSSGKDSRAGITPVSYHIINQEIMYICIQDLTLEYCNSDYYLKEYIYFTVARFQVPIHSLHTHKLTMNIIATAMYRSTTSYSLPRSRWWQRRTSSCLSISRL